MNKFTILLVAIVAMLFVSMASATYEMHCGNCISNAHNNYVRCITDGNSHQNSHPAYSLTLFHCKNKISRTRRGGDIDKIYINHVKYYTIVATAEPQDTPRHVGAGFEAARRCAQAAGWSAQR
ncbi:hypothetical protein DFA_03486 [Cavenderia fasciculata]|uniref:Uncharacterized protein n=1 Tax=Cavenderia fasciculata TaxID=261658 RepID=F4PHQ4_CACFS|nr:uncharacterized protein DFA_03486 [Cavenderia fasciculata]EGG25238.1 hypothetical protein DFA_03486 [Cavenderia fasciculata]|eukprot:XP_004363089.1 hypothetical protein DFA_03486 [Cavenderia fasciculata]